MAAATGMNSAEADVPALVVLLDVVVPLCAELLAMGCALLLLSMTLEPVVPEGAPPELLADPPPPGWTHSLFRHTKPVLHVPSDLQAPRSSPSAGAGVPVLPLPPPPGAQPHAPRPHNAAKMPNL